MPRTLITLATYNEIENLPRLVDDIEAIVPNADLLVIDDNSPDGTGRWCDRRAVADPRFSCLHREAKLGLGSATLEGFRHAIAHDYELVLNLDADFSHPPHFIPSLIDPFSEPASKRVDVTIGSRYVTEGKIEGWPWHRRVMSRCVNFYARLLLRLPMQDCSGSFRCYRVDALRRLDFDAFRSRGYSYLEEILWRLQRTGAIFAEVPIVFVDREKGASKINLGEGVTALWIILRLGLFGR